MDRIVPFFRRVVVPVTVLFIVQVVLTSNPNPTLALERTPDQKSTVINNLTPLEILLESDGKLPKNIDLRTVDTTGWIMIYGNDHITRFIRGDINNREAHSTTATGSLHQPTRAAPAQVTPPLITLPAGAKITTAKQNTSQLNAYFVGNDGALYVAWVIDGSAWNIGAITGPNFAPPGAGVATTKQNSFQINVYVVGNDGALWVSWAPDGGGYQSGRVTEPNFAPPGAHVATIKQNSFQINAYVIGNDGALWVSWAPDGGGYQSGRVTEPNFAPPGGGVAAVKQNASQVNAYVVGNDGALWVSWAPDGGGYQSGRVTEPNFAPPGAGVSSAKQNTFQVNAYVVGNDGALWVSWAPDGGGYQSGRVTEPNFAPPGAGVATTAQNTVQLNTYVVGNDGALWVSWVPDGGSYQSGRVTEPNFAPPGAGVATAKQNDVQINAFSAANDGELWVSWAPDGGSYQTGRITSRNNNDNLFRPNPNGYNFANYGGTNAADLTIADLQRIFGDAAVCQGGIGSPCQPVAAANQWLQNVHNVMAGGHCYGFAVSSLRFYKDQTRPSSFQVGVSRPFGLTLVPTVRTFIAEYFVRQFTQPVTVARWQSQQQTPSQILNQLIQSLQYGWTDPVVLNFFWPLDGNMVGHSVTPYRVDSLGSGRFAVQIYDNNFPNDTTRQITINTVTNRWAYTWGGAPIGGTTGTLELVALSVNNTRPTCPWCAVPTGATPTSQIWTQGGEVLITDIQGRRLGSESGTSYADIPDGVWLPVVGGLGKPMPDIFSIPTNQVLEVSVTGNSEPTAEPVRISLFGSNAAVTIDGGLLNAGQSESLRIAPDATAISYEAVIDKTISIDFSFDTPVSTLAATPNQTSAQTTTFTVQVQNISISANDTRFVQVDQSTGRLAYQGGQNGGSYDVSLVRTTETINASFSNYQISIQPNDTHYIHYAGWDGGDEVALEIDKDSDGSIDQIITIRNEISRVFIPFISN